MRNAFELSWIGETWVAYQLARRGIKTVETGHFFDYDFLTSNHKRIEVKSSLLHIGKKKLKSGHITTWKYWEFGNMKSIYSMNHKIANIKFDRRCDFFVFVCFDENYDIVKSYIIPKEVVGTRRVISVGFEKAKGQYDNYKEKWSLITGR